MKALLAVVALTIATTAPAPPAWSIPVDSRTTGQWIAEAPGLAFVIRNDRVAAIDAGSGRVLWDSRATADGPPAVFAGVVAIPERRDIAIDDARTGRRLASIAASAGASVVGSPAHLVVFEPHRRAICGYDVHGRQSWCRGIDPNGTRIISLGGNLFALASYRGWTFYDADNGNAVARASDADELVGSDGRYVWFTVYGGGLKGLDLNTNRSLALHDSITRGQAIVEHERAVAVVNGRLTEIDLRARRSSRLRIYGRWIGGPVDGKIFIERSDGLYLQSLKAGSRAVAVARYASRARYVTSDRGVGYVGLRDGTLLVIDLRKNRLIRTIATGCDFYEGVTASGATALVQCDAGPRSRLIGFSRAGYAR